VLPIIALMVIAVWLLGVGTLKDLALVQLVGIIVGSYSSIFLATPLLVTLRERTDLVRTHTRRVLNRRKPSKAEAVQDAEPEEVAASLAAKPAPEKPAPGARPVRPTASRTGRPSGKRSTRRR
jgi:preprotein translocase subunit SecF